MTRYLCHIHPYIVDIDESTSGRWGGVAGGEVGRSLRLELRRWRGPGATRTTRPSRGFEFPSVHFLSKAAQWRDTKFLGDWWVVSSGGGVRERDSQEEAHQQPKCPRGYQHQQQPQQIYTRVARLITNASSTFADSRNRFEPAQQLEDVGGVGPIPLRRISDIPAEAMLEAAHGKHESLHAVNLDRENQQAGLSLIDVIYWGCRRK